ncbi:MAG: flagellar hook-basal body complex protein FliE [Rhodobacter sp.]|nr:flagellar hook-basal body complex protein FliE [Rhodobacter sp.]
MDITSAFAAQTYAKARPATAPLPGEAGSSNSFVQLVGNFADTLARGDQTARAAMTGQANPHALVEALAASSLAVETAVTVRDKVVEAYQEILRMPV